MDIYMIYVCFSFVVVIAVNGMSKERRRRLSHSVGGKLLMIYILVFFGVLSTNFFY